MDGGRCYALRGNEAAISALSEGDRWNGYSSRQQQQSSSGRPSLAQADKHDGSYRSLAASTIRRSALLTFRSYSGLAHTKWERNWIVPHCLAAWLRFALLRRYAAAITVCTRVGGGSTGCVQAADDCSSRAPTTGAIHNANPSMDRTLTSRPSTPSRSFRASPTLHSAVSFLTIYTLHAYIHSFIAVVLLYIRTKIRTRRQAVHMKHGATWSP